MHIYFSKNCKGHTFTCYDKVMPFQDGYTEWLANEGAAELILPHDVLLPFIKERVRTFDDKMFGVYDMTLDIAGSYQVSPIVVQNRLNSLSYEIYQYLGGCGLDQLNILSKNQQQKRGISVDSLIDIENKRFTELWFNEKNKRERKPFLS